MIDLSNVASIDKFYYHMKDGSKHPLVCMWGESRVRELRVKNLSAAESVRWKIVNYILNKVLPEFNIAFSRVAFFKEAHYIPSKGRCLLYYFTGDEHDRGGISSRQCGRSKKYKKYPEEGKRYHVAQGRLNYFHRCKFLSEDVIVRGADLYFRNNESNIPKSNGIECFIINSRKYYFTRNYNHASRYFTGLTKLSFPGEDKFDESYHEVIIP